MAAASVNFMDPTITLHTDSPVHTWDITSQVSMVELTLEATVLKRDTFGNDWHTNGRGLKGGKLKLEFYVDFDVNGIFETFVYLWNNQETVEFTIQDSESAAKAEGTFVMSQMPSFSGKVDEDNVASLTFDLTGAVTLTGATIS